MKRVQRVEEHVDDVAPLFDMLVYKTAQIEHSV